MKHTQLRGFFMYTFYTILRMYSYSITHSTQTRLGPWLFSSQKRIASATRVRTTHSERLIHKQRAAPHSEVRAGERILRAEINCCTQKKLYHMVKMYLRHVC